MPAREIAAMGPPDRSGPEPADRDAAPRTVVDHRQLDARPGRALVRHPEARRQAYSDGRDEAWEGRPGSAPDVAGTVTGLPYFSTPVTTTPRMNARWARKNTTTGTAIVMSEAA